MTIRFLMRTPWRLRGDGSRKERVACIWWIWTVPPGHVIVGLDARDGDVATEGWAEASGLPVIDVARRFERAGVASIVYTDIGRDGMMKGVNAEATAALAREIDIPVIASGGVTNIDDIHALCAVADSGISGTIAGRALYEGTLDLAAAQAVGDKQAAH